MQTNVKLLPLLCDALHHSNGCIYLQNDRPVIWDNNLSLLMEHELGICTFNDEGIIHLYLNTENPKQDSITGYLEITPYKNLPAHVQSFITPIGKVKKIHIAKIPDPHTGTTGRIVTNFYWLVRIDPKGIFIFNNLMSQLNIPFSSSDIDDI